ncbi:glycosyltransferase family 4 protein [Singulisphaera sp. PoT]|uniref:glycosyltransferase family 4 protein n=1 Tax=Singulisphaera sp. PoT TaxID=3411797 RepID=UPI003BF52E6C
MAGEPRIGYLGMDVLNNATVCNEAMGLIEAGVPLEVVSIYPVKKATFHQKESLCGLHDRVQSIYPLRRFRVVLALLCAPLLFGWRFWSMLSKAVFGPAEGPRQRMNLIFQTIPATVLAVKWRNKGIRHIHAHWANAATSVAMHAAELLGIGFSFTGHANDLFIQRIGLRAKIQRARFIVCISEFHRRFYVELGADPARVPVIYCGVDVDRLADTASDVPKAIPTRIVSVGRLVEKKGFTDLIAACALLRADGHSFECIIAGSGPEHYNLTQLIQDYQLEDVVYLSGRNVLQEDLPYLLASSQIFALPCVRDRDGDMDGLPQVLMEALACGVPTVSTRLVGIPDLVRDGQNGLLVEAEDVRGLTLALSRLLNFPHLATHLGEQGQSWVREHFSRDECVQRLKSLFVWAADQPGNSSPEPIYPSAPGSVTEYPERLLSKMLS